MEKSAPPQDPSQQQAIKAYQSQLLSLNKMEAQLQKLARDTEDLEKELESTDLQVKSLQFRGQVIGEVLRKLDDDTYIVKASQSRHVVGRRPNIPESTLEEGARVALDYITYTIMRVLPRQIDPSIYRMAAEDPGEETYASVGGLESQIRELREVIELPLRNPQLFKRVGIKPPKGVLLYGPPGTGKTLLARIVAATSGTKFLKVVASSIVDKYIGESARMIREMFAYAREQSPCIIFIDEIDAIGGSRFKKGASSDREVQRTLMTLLAELDGFDELGQVKVIMATNRPDVLDKALLRPGRLDRKIEIGLPNEIGRREILKIHMKNITTKGEIDMDSLVKLSEGFNGADLRGVCTEAAMFAGCRKQRSYCINEDFIHAVRKLGQSKSLETKLNYKLTN